MGRRPLEEVFCSWGFFYLGGLRRWVWEQWKGAGKAKHPPLAGLACWVTVTDRIFFCHCWNTWTRMSQSEEGAFWAPSATSVQRTSPRTGALCQISGSWKNRSVGHRKMLDKAGFMSAACLEAGYDGSGHPCPVLLRRLAHCSVTGQWLPPPALCSRTRHTRR